DARSPPGGDGTFRSRVRLGCWRFRGRRVVPPGPDPGRLDHFHPASGPVTPMVTVLRSQSSRHFLRSGPRGSTAPAPEPWGDGERRIGVLVSRVKMRCGPDQSRYAASAITTNRAPRSSLLPVWVN